MSSPKFVRPKHTRAHLTTTPANPGHNAREQARILETDTTQGTNVPSDAENLGNLLGAESPGTRAGPDSAGTGSGGDDEQAHRDAQETIEALDEVRKDLQQLHEDLVEQRERIDRMIGRVDAQIAAVNEVLQAGPGQPPGGAFKLIAGQQALAADVEDAEESAQGKGQSFWDRIKQKLGSAGKKLWAMISRLVRVKEWSLTGTVGTGVLGVAEASISVTFG